jgi:hypothetical protein
MMNDSNKLTPEQQAEFTLLVAKEDGLDAEIAKLEAERDRLRIRRAKLGLDFDAGDVIEDDAGSTLRRFYVKNFYTGRYGSVKMTLNRIGPKDVLGKDEYFSVSRHYQKKAADVWAEKVDGVVRIVRAKPIRQRKELELPQTVRPGVTLVKYETRKQHEGGCDWGYGERRVIARHGTRFLVWQVGHNAWSGQGQQSYYPAHLILFPHGATRDYVRLTEEGRLTPARLVEHDDTIRAGLGIDFALSEVWKPGTTVVVE